MFQGKLFRNKILILVSLHKRFIRCDDKKHHPKIQVLAAKLVNILIIFTFLIGGRACRSGNIRSVKESGSVTRLLSPLVSTHRQTIPCRD